MKPLEDYGFAPLTEAEKGRHGYVHPDKHRLMERCCAAAMSDGWRQNDICIFLGTSRSRVSRWSTAGLRKYGVATDHRLINCRDRSLTQMLWARIDVRAPNECWPWRGFIKPNGYGSLNYKGKACQAHRAVYEALISPVPRDLVIDHTCERKDCVNPGHPMPVSQSVNTCMRKVRRGDD